MDATATAMGGTWQEAAEGAFVMDVPAGWQVRGQIVRPYSDPAVLLEAGTVTGPRRQIHSQSPAVPIYLEPQPMHAFMGLREGSQHLFPGCPTPAVILRCLGCQGYLQQIYVPSLSQAMPDVQFVCQRPRPELLSFVEMQPQRQYETMEAEFRGTMGGQPTQVKVLLVVTLERSPLVGGVWTVNVTSLTAADGNLAETEAAYWQMARSVRWNPQWQMMVQQQAATARAMANQNTLASQRQMHARQMQIGQTLSQTSDIITSGYNQRSAIHDDVMRRSGNAFNGQNDLYNAETGQTWWGVSNDPNANYYWEVNGRIVGTPTYDPPAFGAVPLQNRG